MIPEGLKAGATEIPDEGSAVQVVWLEDEVVAGSKGLFDAVRRRVERVGSLDTGALARNLQSFCAEIGRAVDAAADAIAKYPLESIELSVEVTAKGEVRLIGAAASEVKGGLKLVFARRDP